MSKQGTPELQVIASFNKPDEANTLYKELWQIETAFKAMKSSGFNIEDTHLTDLERIAKLVSLILIAFVWAYKTGISLDEIAPIPIKKYDRRAHSIFKYGLTHLAKALHSNNLENFKHLCDFLSCT